MSPEVFLLRPVDEKIYLEMNKEGKLTKELGNKMTRLMDVLNYKAKEGVKIYILVYYECSLALTLNSKHTEDVFKELNSNIKVTRHPSDAFTLLWSHHEKLVIIDQMIGYVGGLDLCWGRYDFPQHPIYEPPNPQREYHFPLIDYSNARICDFTEVQNYTIESVKREDTIRMPWHDVHSKIIGPAVCDIARHFIERWNHANFADRREKGLTSINQGAAFSQNKFNFWQIFSGVLKKKSDQIKAKHSTENPLEKLESTQTITVKEENKIGYQENKEIENTFMKDKDKIDDDHLLVKKGTTKPSFYNTLVQRMGKLGNEAMAIDLEHQISNDDLYKKYFKEGSITANVQVLRSASEWSAGIKRTEHSILNGYYELISNAKHYIYIENQFFVSKAWTDEERKQCKHSISDIVKNEIAYYIRKRIEKAYQNNENFKVYIFVPLLPGFAGEPEESPTLQLIVKHTYAGVCKNHGLSLIEQLQKIMGNAWRNYLGFYSLRNHALVNGVPKTEIIYIHSKLMIVDDNKVLLGSANINDRSMLGIRDSEFAVIIKEKKQLINKKCNRNFVMNGDKNYRGTNFATNFRKELMAEHLGINPDDPILDDPVSKELFSLIVSRANSNTGIYHNIFGCYPDDAYTNFELLKKAKKLQQEEKPEVLLNKYNSMKNQIVGHIVNYPLTFLKDENLGISFFSKENLVPEHNFT
jgi:phospholipase D1/2